MDNDLLQKFLDPATDVLFIKSDNLNLANQLSENYKDTVTILFNKNDVPGILDLIPTLAVNCRKLIIVNKSDCPDFLKNFVDLFYEVEWCQWI